jgi:site-specific recombinase XerC
VRSYVCEFNAHVHPQRMAKHLLGSELNSSEIDMLSLSELMPNECQTSIHTLLNKEHLANQYMFSAGAGSVKPQV